MNEKKNKPGTFSQIRYITHVHHSPNHRHTITLLSTHEFAIDVYNVVIVSAFLTAK